MEASIYVGILMIGFVAGFMLAGFIYRNSRGPGLAASEEEFAGLKARLQERDNLLTELRVALENAHAEGDRLRGDVRTESEKRAALDSQVTRMPAMEEALTAKDRTLSAMQGEIAALKAQLTVGGQRPLLEEIQQRVGDIVRVATAEAAALAVAEARHSPNRENGPEKDEARRQVEDAVRPLQDSLAKVDERLGAFERERMAALAALADQVRALADTQVRLQGDTAELSRALKAPAGRSHWGQVQLRRVVELSGLVEHCDFSDGGANCDLVIHLPGNREIAVDARIPLSAYFEAMENGNDASRAEKLAAHAAAVRSHMQGLAASAPPKADFVVAFVPGDSFLAAAVDQDPALIEDGMQHRVLLSTPTSLMALLKAVSFGWRQEGIAQNAAEISQMGRALYERLAALTGHFDEMRTALEGSVEAYNRAARALDGQVLASARRFKELGAVNGAELQAPVVYDLAALAAAGDPARE